MPRALRLIVVVNSALVIGLALAGFLYPALAVVLQLRDPGLSTGEIPRFAFTWHRKLAPKYERWAHLRIASDRAGSTEPNDVSGTEWPLFGSVFFLWATESLQSAWDRDHTKAAVAPSIVARGAILAAADLLADPRQAGWVKARYGPGYLDHDNLFYRMLLIAGLGAAEKLSGDKRHHPLLAGQAESLASELDRSRHGLLEDYPGECYPIDILPAIAAIRRADHVLGTDRSAFALRALRGFEGRVLDPATGLPSYEVEAASGQGIGTARGIGVAYMLIWAPELWPTTARAWYHRASRFFWQSDPLLAGFREYPRGDRSRDWSLDVDAGPVLAGYGTAASAFGIGAARANGRFDHAYPLAAQALAASWPLPDGTRLLPRFLSNLAEAPYLGECALLFVLTRQPVILPRGAAAPIRTPLLVPIVLGFWLACGMATVAASLLALRRWSRGGVSWHIPALHVQLCLWITILAVALAASAIGRPGPCLLLLLTAQLLPRGARLEPATPRAGSAPP